MSDDTDFRFNPFDSPQVMALKTRLAALTARVAVLERENQMLRHDMNVWPREQPFYAPIEDLKAVRAERVEVEFLRMCRWEAVRDTLTGQLHVLGFGRGEKGELRGAYYVEDPSLFAPDHQVHIMAEMHKRMCLELAGRLVRGASA